MYLVKIGDCQIKSELLHLTILLLHLAACGSGSGEASSNTNSNSSASSSGNSSSSSSSSTSSSSSGNPDNQTPPLQYKGLKTQSLITRTNYKDFLYATLVFSGTIARQSGFLNSIPEALKGYSFLPYIKRECSDGDKQLDLTESQDGRAGTLMTDYQNCLVERFRLSGKTIEDSFFDESNLFHENRNLNIQFSSAGNSIELGGNINRSNGASQGDMLLYRDSESGSTYMMENYHINQSTFAAKIFVSQHGFIDVEYNHESRSMTMNGKDSMSLKVNAKTSDFSDERFTFELLLGQIQNGKFVDEPLSTTLAPPQISNHIPPRKNAEPFFTEQPMPSLVRGDSIRLDASAVTDNEGDFLTYMWSLEGKSDSACAEALTATEGPIAEYKNDCRGNFVVNLTINDGINTETILPIPVTVQPQLPEFTSIPPIELSHNEPLDIALTVTNAVSDGTPNYSLAYGPNGILVSPEGVISGTLKAFANDSDSKFTIAVNADNGRVATQEITIQYKPQKIEKKLFPVIRDCFLPNIGWRDMQADGIMRTICPFHNSYAIFSLENEQRTLTFFEISPPEPSLLRTIGLTHFDDDPQMEIVLVYDKNFYVIDGISRIIEYSNSTLIDNIDLSKLQIFSSNIDRPGVLFSTQKTINNQNYFYNANTQKIDSLATGSLVHLFGNTQYYSLNKEVDYLTLLNEEKIDTASEVDFADFNGDGLMERIDLSFSTTKDNAIDIVVKNLENGEITFSDQIIFQGLPNFNPAFYSHKAISIDADPELEILIYRRSTAEEILILDSTEGQFNALTETIDGSLCNLLQVHLQPNPNIVGSFFFSDEATNRQCLFIPERGMNPLEDIWKKQHRAIANPTKGLSNVLINREGKFFSLSQHNEKQEAIQLTFASDIRKPNQMSLSFPSPFSFRSTKILSNKTRTNWFALSTNPFFNRSVSIYNSLTDTNNNIQEEISSNSKYFTLGSSENGMTSILAIGEKYVTIEAETGTVIETFDPPRFQSPLDVQVADLNHDGTDEFIHLESAATGNTYILEVYNIKDGVFQLLEKLIIPNTKQRFKAPPALAIQDVDADGLLEIIAYDSSNPECSKNSSKASFLVDHDLKVIGEPNLEGCISTLPNILSSEPKKNILAHTHYYDSTEGHSAILFNAFFAYVEISPIEGRVVWQSTPFLGSPNPKSITFDGTGIYSSGKATTSSAGIYFFR